MDKDLKMPSPYLSVIPIVVLVILLAITIHLFGSDALSGGSQICLLLASGVCTLLSTVFCNTKWKILESGIIDNVSSVTTALFILLLIGALSGSWMLSGVVPILIYYGIQLLRPEIFLVSCCIISAIISLMTGSSWTTIATIGVALMGIGQAQGFSVGWVAGSIISGAYFGDKISPLSDTTVLASSTTHTPLFDHIRYMLYTTIPSIIITLIVFLIAGALINRNEGSQTVAYTEALSHTFHLTPWLLFVPLLTGIMIAKKMPSLVVLFLSALLGVLFALWFQPEVLRSISGLENEGTQALWKGAYQSVFGSTQINTGDASLNKLVATHGMRGMLDTIWLILCAMCFGGTMSASGMLRSLVTLFIRFMKKRVSMVVSTVMSGLLLNLCTGDQYISIVLTGNLFKDIYKKKGYESRLLSRTTEDAVTVTSVLIPWNTCGMTQATILGVPTLTYLPYCIFNIVSPIMSIFIAAIGYKIVCIYEKN
ncbi:MAG: Na+/H+ antiporter NhaC family protein [Bacteroidaceae bacterium]